MAVSEKTVRRTQAERSAATQEALLNATIECLAEFGYTGTTVTRIAERASVTRGAQVHHFPTKEHLVLSAVERLNEIRAHDLVLRMSQLQAGSRWVEDLLDMMWDLHQGPVFVATAEMWIAARSDAHLADHIGEVENAVMRGVAEASDLPGRASLANPEVRDAVYTAMDAMRGLVIGSWHLDERELDARWHRLKRHLLMTFPANV